MAEREFVILVNRADRVCGQMEKMAAHRIGVRHRAFSIMLGNRLGQVLLQRRALGKYHSGGLWANSCCGHPRPGEDVTRAAARRLREELNIEAGLRPVGLFSYRAMVGGGLMENELVHFFHGSHDGPVHPNADEVMETRWVDPASLTPDGDHLTPWLRLYIAENPGFLQISRPG
jgi:isopentenyl-diphosphate delta-isomerase